MKKRIFWFSVMFIVSSIVLSACGEKSAEDIVAKMEQTIASLEDYQAEAEMIMNTGQEEHVYDVSIWHKKDDYYRVALNNPVEEKNSQVILKNKDGVFVLTPTLNKSYKFQTDWPENSSQPYLYESLLHDINEDDSGEFQTTDSHYIFLTKTNYQSNENLPYQEIFIDKKTYVPTHVNVLDRDREPLVQVKFTQFTLNNNLTADDFSIDETDEETDEQTVTAEDDMLEQSLQTLFPLYTAGSELADIKEVTLDDGERVIMTFQGDKNFTLVQEKQHSIPTQASTYEPTDASDLVHLGFAVGALSVNKVEWVYDGTEFLLASEDLTKDELIEVAQSVQGEQTK